MAADLNVYNYLVTDFNTSPTTTKYSTHKDSELRSIVQDIAKMTESSPLYLVKLSDEKQTYALNVKESSIALNTAFKVLAERDSNSIFGLRKAVSSQEDQVTVRIDTDDYERLPESFTLKVNSLAKTQVNVSKEVYETSRAVETGMYRFRINVNDAAYDFQYNIKKDATHKDVLAGLSDFITKAKIGIHAGTISREKGKLAMRLETDLTGTPDGQPIMTFEDLADGRHGKGIVSLYGLNRIEQQPRNAQFDLNGTARNSMSNTFKLAHSLQIELKHPGKETAEINYTPDSEKIIQGVQNVLDNYNQMVGNSWEYVGHRSSIPKLIREMRAVMYPFQSDMESCGITFDDQGYMQMDKSLAEQSALDGSFKDLLGAGSSLGMRMMAKTDTVKLNPMEYVEKILVAYPDTSKPPEGYSYTTSLYSGMLFNYYY
ncbi:MAG: hypothetical protein J1E62_02930 [Lachnospiraceae bacterium]|nr:hypothetical protein [Lachnospiraceae bacterium]